MAVSSSAAVGHGRPRPLCWKSSPAWRRGGETGGLRMQLREGSGKRRGKAAPSRLVPEVLGDGGVCVPSPGVRCEH